ncbi:MAG TPA: hypothetical protein VK589_00675 [Chryseolinea sp.]|nr:hypothetical protein [Chryseolinea sp.]
MKALTTTALVIVVLNSIYIELSAQQKKILVDVGHGQKFYSDPADKISTDLVPTDRLQYMTGELSKNGATHKAVLGYVKSPITPSALSKSDMLFIHTPSAKYSSEECAAIQQFVEKGGALFIVMEVDYWSTLAQANVNDIVKPFGITFTSDSPDQSSGGHSIISKITKQKYSIPSHGARLVEGGTPFAFSNASDTNPIGVYTETKGAGKVIAMGEGMASLYMNSWQDVTDYQCAPFMEEVVGWLLK